MYPAGHKSLLQLNAANFTVQVLTAESAKASGRAPLERLLWLKSWATRLVNQTLGDPSQRCSITAVASVLGMAVNSMIENDGFIHAHMVGLTKLLFLKGGLGSIESEFVIYNLAKACDYTYSYLYGGPLRYSPVDPDDEMAYSPINPLRQALLPTRSGLDPRTLRRLFVVSTGAPIQALLLHLKSIRILARAALNPPYVVGPAQARMQLDFQDHDLRQRFGPGVREYLDTPYFSPKDNANQNAINETVFLIAVLLIAHFINLIERSQVSVAHLDNSVQSLLLTNLDPHNSIYDPRIMCWCLFIGTSFAIGDQRSPLVALLARICKKLGLANWQKARALLNDIYYSDELLDPLCSSLWREVEQEMRLKLPSTEQHKAANDNCTAQSLP